LRDEAVTVEIEPGRERPWWEVDAGPLAERVKRENWTKPRD
jgi:hypothetical protein